jgi:hypothetical protein
MARCFADAEVVRAVMFAAVARGLTTRMAGTVGPVGASTTSSNLVHRPELLDSGSFGGDDEAEDWPREVR